MDAFRRAEESSADSERDGVLLNPCMKITEMLVEQPGSARFTGVSIYADTV